MKYQKIENFVFFKLFLVIFGLNFAIITDSWAVINSANPFVVEEVVVKVTARNPAEARTLATQTARRDAFLILLKRLSLGAKVSERISDEEVTDMVRSEQIDQEKVSGNSYSAVYSITFAKDFVDHILAEKRTVPTIKFRDVTTSTVILPAKIIKRKILLWENDNNFREAVEEAVKISNRNDFRVPEADIDNMAALNTENIMHLNSNDLNDFFARYKSEKVYLLLYAYDYARSRATVTVKAYEKMGKTQYSLSFVNSDDLNEQAFLDKVSVNVIDYITKLQNGEEDPTQGMGQAIEFNIDIKNLGEWLMIKSKLESSNLVRVMNVESISRDYVKISVISSNPSYNIVETFGQNGFSLKRKSANIYDLKLN